MKLLAKYNRVNIPIAIATLLISSIAYYFILHFVLLRQLDKDLLIEQEEIIHHIHATDSLPESSSYKDQHIEFHLTNEDHFITRISTDAFNNKNKTGSFRKLEFLVAANGNNYIAEVKKSQQETENIIKLILLITLSVIVFLLLILFIANRFLLVKMWQPFYQTLEQLKRFHLSSKDKIDLPQTGISEFNELNETALSMTQKVRNDYELLKSFTENASHEIQTPLAIIKNKIELLSQSENLDEAQMQIIESLNAAASRLSRLNQSLLLLTKIENRQFENTENVNVASVIEGSLDNLKELAEIKNIHVESAINSDLSIEMNESLAEILISNIMINAIKHNYHNGDLRIDLDANSLAVSNTGNSPRINTSEMFERFKKDSSAGESLGLGLAIVKTICDIYGFMVSYDYVEERHVVKVHFKK